MYVQKVIAEGASSPHDELLHNYDTSIKPTAGFRGALRTGEKPNAVHCLLKK